MVIPGKFWRHNFLISAFWLLSRLTSMLDSRLECMATYLRFLKSKLGFCRTLACTQLQLQVWILGITQFTYKNSQIHADICKFTSKLHFWNLLQFSSLKLLFESSELLTNAAIYSALLPTLFLSKHLQLSYQTQNFHSVFLSCTSTLSRKERRSVSAFPKSKLVCVVLPSLFQLVSLYPLQTSPNRRHLTFYYISATHFH